MVSLWFILTGVLLVLMAVAGSAMERLPVSTALIYLLIGLALGPSGLGLVTLDPASNAGELRIFCEVAVLVSLFTVGLKLRVSPTDRLLRLPLRLATISMVVVVACVAAIGYWALHMPLGAAVLLGAILSPTDPVLASDVQVRHADDRERSRFALTAEGGINDGTAAPFVILGLGLLNIKDLGSYGLHWVAVDIVWAIAAGLMIGWAAGKVVARIVLFVRREFKEAVGWEEFLALGLLALSYGLALLVHGNGFLAVLAAGLAMRRVETESAEERSATLGTVAKSEEKTHPATAPTHLVRTVLGSNERFERIGELIVVLALGASLSTIHINQGGIWIALALFLAIRPLSVVIGLAGMRYTERELRLMSWFGIRGIGSVFYLMYAIEAGLPADLVQRFVSIVFTVVAASIALHGVSATPLMNVARMRKR